MEAMTALLNGLKLTILKYTSLVVTQLIGGLAQLKKQLITV